MSQSCSISTFWSYLIVDIHYRRREGVKYFWPPSLTNQFHKIKGQFFSTKKNPATGKKFGCPFFQKFVVFWMFWKIDSFLTVFKVSKKKKSPTQVKNLGIHFTYTPSRGGGIYLFGFFRFQILLVQCECVILDKAVHWRNARKISSTKQYISIKYAMSTKQTNNF